jgi:hypothetical protein
MRVFALSLLALSCVALLMIATPKPAFAGPSVLPLTQGQTARQVEEVGYRYRRYRYGYRRHYRPYYRPYAYYRPYYRPYYGYYGYPYYYRPYYYRPGLSFWFGF